MRRTNNVGTGGTRWTAAGVRGWCATVEDRLRTQSRRIVLVAVAAVVVVVVALPGRPAAQEEVAAPLIVSVQVDAEQQRLSITGLNFGTAAPTVSVALSRLTLVTPTSTTSVQAVLPALLPGTYLLVLERSDEALATFYLTLGAMGPAGPAGPAGPPGPAVYQ